jgi:hypothetical protein
VTLISAIVICTLVIGELRAYMNTRIVEELFVDSTSVNDEQYIDIHFDIRFHAIACAGKCTISLFHINVPAALTVDVMDVSGAHQTDINDHIYKANLDEHGNALETARKMCTFMSILLVSTNLVYLQP